MKIQARLPKITQHIFLENSSAHYETKEQKNNLLDSEEIVDEWCTTGEPHKKIFLLFDDGVNVEDRMVIFVTHEGLQHLSNSSRWYMDGNFGLAPKDFLQLYQWCSGAYTRNADYYSEITSIMVVIDILFYFVDMQANQISAYIYKHIGIEKILGVRSSSFEVLQISKQSGSCSR
ncbi:Uncharacterized protein FWK35_00018231 [Aphis craccivora]|uniref:Uncharacterized protein n=1 Tax=Aphis craccivora TaxID=307492 RepID=A0A6G0Y2G9_APHCR|nr:Uncharacterized protein FWK35_00018231 [Aphis craccivora]